MAIGIGDLLFRVDWQSMLVPALSFVEKIIRPLLVYVFMVLALRIAGKREMAQLNNFDFVVILLLSNTVQNAIIGNDVSVSGGIIGAITLLVANYFAARIFFKHPKLERTLEGRSDPLISDGKLNRDRLKKELITEEELELAAHKQGIESLSDVEKAELEPDGDLFFVRKTPPIEQLRHDEIMRRLESLSEELERLRREAGRA